MAVFDTVLIANRGEIAVRIARACRALGIDSVAVYSDADREAPHVTAADRAVWIGASPAAESYLRGDTIIEAARRVGADAIHPGYGFLAESTDFARACEAAGIVFIGPTADAMARMADKDSARAVAVELGVPVVPGAAEPVADAASAARMAAELGYPVLLKAAAGGGGTGMRVVEREAELDDALATVRAEAKAAFGDDRVLIEKYLHGARHIEVQVLADSDGQFVHLFERECSIQRRRQKIIEEAPVTTVPETTLTRLREAALRLARGIEYRGAGTVEFLVDGRGEPFYFLEMNTRLQVEHPVTEAVTGIDLVEWQLRIAQGESLAFTQDDIVLRGHAIECRLCTERPEHDFLPAAGHILKWRPPPHVRVDAGIATGQTLSAHYDSLVAKIVSWGADRAQATRAARQALRDTVLLGVASNRDYLARVLASDDWRDGAFDTEFTARRAQLQEAVLPAGDDYRLLLGAAVFALTPPGDYWPGATQRPRVMRLRLGEQDLTVAVTRTGQDAYRLSEGDVAWEVVLEAVRERGESVREWVLSVDGLRDTVIGARGEELWLHSRRGGIWTVAEHRDADAATGGVAERWYRAPMPGTVVSVAVGEGSQVRAGDTLLVLDSMKMQSGVECRQDGRVVQVRIEPGQTVATGDRLIEIEPDNEEALS